MTSYKAVFSDMDGTLLNSQHQITSQTVTAIQRINQLGVPFIIVSARPPLAITPYTKQLEIDSPIVCFGGALILDKNLTALYSVAIEQKDLIALNQILQGIPELSINYYFSMDWVSNDIHHPRVIREMDITAVKATQAEAGKTYPAHKILIMADESLILNVEKQLKQQFPHLSIHRSLPTYLEIMNSQATKAQALQFMQKALGIEAEETIAFGDNFNDLDMIKYAGLGVAMGNAPDEIKQSADLVTCSNNEDGIALVLNKVF